MDLVGSVAWRPRLRAATKAHGPALAGFLALTLAFFWPILVDLRTRILVEGGDGAFFLWNLWWVPRALFEGHNPFTTTTMDLFHPVGVATAFNTSIPLVGFVSWPLQQLFGLAVAANLTQLAAVVLSALGAYLLALHVGASRLPAFFAGVAFAFTPWRLGHLAAHVNLNHTELLPFAFLALLRLYDRPSRGRAVALGVMGGVTFLTNGNYALFLAMAAVVVAAWHWRETFTRAFLVRAGQAVLVAGLIALPMLGAMVHEAVIERSLDPIPGWGGADVFKADLASWLAPPPGRRFLPDMLGRVNPAATRGESMVFPTWTLLAVGLAGMIAGGRRSRIWTLLTFVFGILSLGPFLEVNGWRGSGFTRFDIGFGVPLPYLLLQQLRFLNELRVPGRFCVVAILSLSVLGALALTRLARARPRAGMVAVAVAVPLLLAEALPAGFVPTMPSAIPRAYDAIAADDSPGAVLEIPLQWQTGLGNYGDWEGVHTVFMYYATRHRRPIAGSVVSRYPAKDLERLVDIPVYDQIMGLQPGTPEGTYLPVPVGRPAGAEYPDPSFTVADLRRSRIGFVVTHRDRPRPAVEAYLDGLGLPVLADDGTVVVRTVPPAG
ncbi:MAG: hypothetical protein ACRD0O_06340 [Acidimicrobiia bacterium]